MAQTNYTPIILYNSGTTTNAPSASNLASGELAINYTDGKLFYKDNSSAIQVIGWKTTPTTAGGTGLTSYTAGDLPYYASGSALSKLGIGTANYVLTSSGTAPQYVAQSTLSVGSATNATNTAITDNTSSSATWYPTIVSATTGNLPQTTSSTKLSFVPSTGTLTATNHAGAWAGSTIGTGYGGTGLTSFTANGVVYASSTSALTTGSALVFDGTNLLVNTTSALTSSSDAKVQFYTSIVAGNNDSGYSTTAGYHQLMYKTAEGNITNMFGNNGSTGFNMSFRSVASYGANGAASGFILGKNSSTNRSINAGGTINASGADYAEYMTKAGAFTIAKGNVVGINAEGKLTNVFADAISFCVKSTNPSYVGGDVWGSAEVLGLKEPKETSSQEEKDAFNEALEIARQTVDRIAFAGQVPVNVTGATAGQYIVPIANQDGSIGGQAVSESAMTLQQYMQSVGKVISVVGNVTTIIVKVA